VAVIVDAATDNRNRTASEIRFLFSRADGALVKRQRGLDVRIARFDRGRSAETLGRRAYERALVDGVIDVRFGEPTEIVTEPTRLMAAKDDSKRPACA